jgi:hypothetical protein
MKQCFLNKSVHELDAFIHNDILSDTKEDNQKLIVCFLHVNRPNERIEKYLLNLITHKDILSKTIIVKNTDVLKTAVIMHDESVMFKGIINVDTKKIYNTEEEEEEEALFLHLMSNQLIFNERNSWRKYFENNKKELIDTLLDLGNKEKGVFAIMKEITK